MPFGQRALAAVEEELVSDAELAEVENEDVRRTRAVRNEDDRGASVDVQADAGIVECSLSNLLKE